MTKAILHGLPRLRFGGNLVTLGSVCLLVCAAEATSDAERKSFAEIKRSGDGH